MSEVVKINQVINQGLIINSIQTLTKSGERCLTNLSPKGINAYDLIGERAAPDSVNKAVEMIQMNFGVKAQDEKVLMLAEMILEDGWSEYRLQRTLKWFLKNKKFAAWTIADWYDYGVKLYPYSWYVKQISEGVRNNELEGYRVKPDVVLWKMKDGESELPFEKIN